MNHSKWMHVGDILKMNAFNHSGNLGWQDKTREFTFSEWNGQSLRKCPRPLLGKSSTGYSKGIMPRAPIAMSKSLQLHPVNDYEKIQMKYFWNGLKKNPRNHMIGQALGEKEGNSGLLLH